MKQLPATRQMDLKLTSNIDGKEYGKTYRKILYCFIYPKLNQSNSSAAVQ